MKKPTTILEIHQRIDMLRDVYSFSKKHKLLTDAQRTAITFERIAWLRVIEIIKGSDTAEMPEPTYTLLPELHEKVIFIAQKIQSKALEK